ncbi:MAG: SPOR domain-containing protein [Sulfurimonas sp.]|jgi:DedD protein
MQEKNELNDIILNRGGAANNNKKIILAVATLGVILIIVVMLMDSVTSNGTDNLPQAVLPPKPELKSAQLPSDEPLFEEVKVVKDENKDSNNLDDVAKKLKQESQETLDSAPVVTETVSKKEVVKEEAPAKEVVKTVTPVKDKFPAEKPLVAGSYYIQVGSFSKYEPNQKFLKSITDKGYTYTYQNVTKGPIPQHKILVGPFKAEQEARDALKVIRANVEAGAFLTKM